MDDDGDDTKRKSRNLSEKKRRDQFNLLVNDLSSMVSNNSRKMDKSTVLKSTILFLKSHNEISVRSRVHEIQENWKPSFLSNEEYTHLTLEALDGFIMVFSTSGRIVYASESITSLLGHLPGELLNTTIFELAYEDDRPNLFNLLRTSTSNIDNNVNEFHSENQFSFTCHLKRGALDFRKEPSYEVVNFVGYFRFCSDTLDADELVSNTFFRPMLIFVATGRLQTPQLIREMSIVESSKSEFTSRQSLEWKFLFLDHRAPPIIGYLPFEVLGTSGYDYYHFDDLEKVVICHEALMQKGEGTSCYYRFLTKGQQWIWLQTRFYITYHQWSAKPEFVVCTHRVVSYADVIKQLPKEPSTSELENVSLALEPPLPAIPQDTKYFSDINPRPSQSQISEGAAWSQSSRSSHHSTSGNMSQCESAASSRNAQMTSAHTHNNPDIVTMESVNSHSNMSSQRSHHQCGSSCHQCDTKSIIPKSQEELMVQRQISPHQDMRVQVIPQQSIQYLDSTYVATVPIQPAYPSQAIIPAIPPGPEIQEHLQKKHEELQQIIIHQQEELRRVSEQLVMARYGLLPPSINMSIPYNQQPQPILAASPCITLGPQTMPLPLLTPDAFSSPGPSQSIPHRNDHPNHQVHMHDMHTYVPMQMSQQQAQLLFNSGPIEPRQNLPIQSQEPQT